MAVLIIDVVALLIHPVDLERGTFEQNRLAGLLVDLGYAQVDLDLFVQHRIFLVAVAGCLNRIFGVRHAGLGVSFVGGVNVHNEGLSLEHIFRRGALDD